VGEHNNMPMRQVTINARSTIWQITLPTLSEECYQTCRQLQQFTGLSEVDIRLLQSMLHLHNLRSLSCWKNMLSHIITSVYKLNCAAVPTV